MAAHELKTHPEPFRAMWHGIMIFQYRKDDREPRFQVGDWLHLREWIPAPTDDDPDAGHYTGRLVAAQVAYVERNNFGIPPGYCVMSLSKITMYPERFAYRATTG